MFIPNHIWNDKFAFSGGQMDVCISPENADQKHFLFDSKNSAIELPSKGIW